MWRCPLRIAGIPNVSKNVAGIHNISGPEPSEPVEMGVVVTLPARPEHVDDAPSQLIGSDASDDAVRRAQHRSAVRSEDVDALMRSPSAPWETPRIGDLSPGYAHHRNSHSGRWGRREKPHKQPRVTKDRKYERDQDTKQHNKCKRSDAAADSSGFSTSWCQMNMRRKDCYQSVVVSGSYML